MFNRINESDSNAKIALNHAIELEIVLSNLFNAEYRNKFSLPIHLHVLWFQVLQTVHTIWEICKNNQDNAALQHVRADIQDFLNNGVMQDFGTPSVIDEVAVKLRDSATPFLQKIVDEKSDCKVVEMTMEFIIKLHNDNLPFLSVNHDCIKSIKETLQLMGGLIKNCTAQELKDDTHRTNALKLMILRIGAYWHTYCNQHSTSSWESEEISGLRVVRLNECREIYKLIQNVPEYIDFKHYSLLALLNLAKSLIGKELRSPARVSFIDSPKQAPIILGDLDDLMSLKDNVSARNALQQEIQLAFERSQVVTNEWLKLNSEINPLRQAYSDFIKSLRALHKDTLPVGLSNCALTMVLLSKGCWQEVSILRSRKEELDSKELTLAAYFQSTEAFVAYVNHFQTPAALTENCHKLITQFRKKSNVSPFKLR